MRHRTGYRKLSRPTDQRMAILRDMSMALLRHGKIKATEKRAKEAVRMVSRVITLAKKGDLPARRMAAAMIPDQGLIKDLFNTVAERFGDRAGGYTRLTKIGFRRGDSAPLVLMELVLKE